jgi:membrane fusion protein (multidrug efflux system)
MATTFERTIGALRGDGFRRSISLLAVVSLLIGVWAFWLFRAEVTLYEVSDRARVEVDQAAHVVQAPIAGRIVSSHLVMGQEVEAGDILAEIDSRVEQLRIQEEQTRLRVVAPQVESLQAEVAAIERALRQESETAAIAKEEALARYREADGLARLADNEAQRLSRLRESGLVSERDLTQAAAQAASRHAAAESLQLAARRLEDEQRSRQSDREARLQRLQGEIRQLEGLKTTGRATIERLENEVDLRRVRAPVRGRLGEVAVLRVGAFVEEGDKLGSVLPRGDLNIVAEFLPPSAFGRIHPGQLARVRLDGFPWTQYGTIAAEVADVASEVRDGRVRVDLRVQPNSRTPVQLQHGLPGSVEVEVERLSPAALLFRAAGKIVAAPTASGKGTVQ